MVLKKTSRMTTMKAAVISLGSTKLRDHDIIAKLLARDYGRIDAVAYGARKSGSRFSALRGILVSGEAVLTRRGESELWIVKEFEKSEGEDEELEWRHSIAMQSIAELMVLGGPEERMEEDMFELVAGFRSVLPKCKDPFAALLGCAVHWSIIAGFGLPEVEAGSGAGRFIDRARRDDADGWKRYRVSAATRNSLIACMTAHIERNLDRSWKGIRILKNSCGDGEVR